MYLSGTLWNSVDNFISNPNSTDLLFHYSRILIHSTYPNSEAVQTPLPLSLIFELWLLAFAVCLYNYQIVSFTWSHLILRATYGKAVFSPFYGCREGCLCRFGELAQGHSREVAIPLNWEVGSDFWVLRFPCHTPAVPSPPSSKSPASAVRDGHVYGQVIICFSLSCGLPGCHP